MIPTRVSKRVVVDRLAWIDRMVAEIRALPLQDRTAFFADRRNVWAAESCLRRALEALLDLGRHILAKGFGIGVSEYKEIARQLRMVGVLSPEDAELLEMLAGYRNRLVHFYHQVSEEELYEICTYHLQDLERLGKAIRAWVRTHPEMVDDIL